MIFISEVAHAEGFMIMEFFFKDKIAIHVARSRIRVNISETNNSIFSARATLVTLPT
jgi:hypothetical protein